MRKFSIWFIAVLLAALTLGQEKSNLGIAFSTGLLTSNKKSAQARSYYSADFDYFLARRHILSANFNAGKHDYYDVLLSNVPVHPETPTNAEAAHRTFSIIYKYLFLDGKKFAAGLGGGIGIMTHITTYQYWEPDRGDVRQASWTGIVFPLRLDVNYLLSQHFRLGVIGGVYLHPDDGAVGYYAGPRLGYIID